MADKEEKAKPAAAPAKAEKKEAADSGKPVAAPAAAAAGGGVMGMLGKTPVLLGGVMLIEAIVLFAGFKFIGGGAPKVVAGAELVTQEPTKGDADGKGAAAGQKTEEMPVVDFRAPNKQSGRTFLYDVSIVAVTKTADADAVKDILKANDALIKDRIRTIIAQLDPEKLGGGSEPGLETLRRQVKYQLDQIVGEGMIDEILVPRCIPFRTDF
jgi:flagellar basal body-associated protein FliL